MNNQAAQTMPEPVTASMCPSSDYAKGWNDCLAALSPPAGVESLDGRVCGYTPGESKVNIALDVGALPEWLELGWPVRVVNPAAPAASGREGDMCPNCVTPWKCNGPHEAPSGASVSERALELLAAQCDKEGSDLWADALRNGEYQHYPFAFGVALRALARALSSPRQEGEHAAVGQREDAKATFVPCDCGCGRSCCAFCGNDIGFVSTAASTQGAWQQLETWLGTFADSIPTEAYNRLVAIQRAILTSPTTGADGGRA